MQLLFNTLHLLSHAVSFLQTKFKGILIWFRKLPELLNEIADVLLSVLTVAGLPRTLVDMGMRLGESLIGVYLGVSMICYDALLVSLKSYIDVPWLKMGLGAF